MAANVQELGGWPPAVVIVHFGLRFDCGSFMTVGAEDVELG